MTMERPRICYENKLTTAKITVATSDTIKTRLVDRNAERRWVSTSGDQTGTFTLAITESIDTIVIQNTNMKTFTIKYNTSTNFTPTLSQAVATVGTGYGDFYFKVSAVTPTTNIIIAVTETTDALPLQVGQIVVTKEIMEVSASGSMRIPTTTKQFLKDMSDGTINKVYVRRLNGYELTLNNVSVAQRTLLMSVYDENKRKSVFFIARPSMGEDAFDGLADHVNWTNEFDFNDYYNDLVTNGFTGTMKLSACGGVS